ncbi:MAG: complex I NDUFA9 subunit family protein [Lamprobacter sp.]|uniref:complex I NDUFA9 subunit family protein n=1 Tax=Lamprobacter sp. TaxID=3100796 RepID=UPI002B25A38B|nr:complex I NDUFA9 subunit family protein [Lamprobacter sp.]MEA3640820.1 complex I NDUFA9 subunit family protein [Lamprobacter sp.]
MRTKTICILGGAGFVGQHLVRRLGAAGWQCRVPTRRPHRYPELKLIQHLSLVPVDRLDQASLIEVLAGCDAVVNLVGILNEQGRTTFEGVHLELVRGLTAAAQAAAVPRLIQMSALNADATGGSSAYLRSKGAGEDLAHQAAGLQVTSLRPSVIFGRGDRFFNRFASLLEMAPGLFPLACPDARFAPVWVGDVCEAISRALREPSSIGRRYDLCGPRVFRLEELVEQTARWIGKRCLLIRLNDRASRWQAQLFERLPGKPFTMDNYWSMQTPSVCAEHDGLLELGIHPTDIETIVPTYLR